MPRLPKDTPVTVKLDSNAGLVDVALTREQRRGLFEHPGTVVVAIVELTAKTYTGHADDEDKDAQVKVRITGCEVAQDDEEAASLLEAKRAMWRRRRMDGTLDEVGNGPRTAARVLDTAFAGYPTEDEYEANQRAREDRRRGEFVR